MKHQRFLSARDFGQQVGLSSPTVIRICDAGLVPGAFRAGAGSMVRRGPLRIPASAVREFMARNAAKPRPEAG